MRLAFGLLPAGSASASTYVDDPIAPFIGSDSENELSIAVVVGGLLALGFDLAFDKAQDSLELGRLVWTTATIRVDNEAGAIEVEVKPEILHEVQEAVQLMMATTTVLIADLRTLAGRATCISTLLHVWRPFIAMLWAPIYSHRSRCQLFGETVWTSAITIP